MSVSKRPQEIQTAIPKTQLENFLADDSVDAGFLFCEGSDLGFLDGCQGVKFDAETLGTAPDNFAANLKRLRDSRQRVGYDIMTVFSIALTLRWPLFFSAVLLKIPIRIRIRPALRPWRDRRCLKVHSKMTSQFGRRCLPSGCENSEYPGIPMCLRLAGQAPQRSKMRIY